MAIWDSKDHRAYPDLIFHYTAPSADHLYANPRKARVGIVNQAARPRDAREGMVSKT